MRRIKKCLQVAFSEIPSRITRNFFFRKFAILLGIPYIFADLDNFFSIKATIQKGVAILRHLQWSAVRIIFSSEAYSLRGILGSPRHSPHLWFIPSTHLDFLAIFIIPSPHLDIHTLTSPRVQIILPPHLDRHTLTSPRGFVIPKGGKLY